MNIEEIKKIVRQEMEDSSPSVKEVLKLNDSLKYWANKCKELEKEKRELNTKILSAIEYIESKEEEEHINDYDEHYMDDYLDDYDEHLLNILKGKDE